MRTLALTIGLLLTSHAASHAGGIRVFGSDSRTGRPVLMQINARSRAAKRHELRHTRRWFTAGLGIGAGGCLLGSVVCRTRVAALDQATEYYAVEMDTATTYEGKREIEQQWNDAVEQSESFTRAGTAFLSCSIGMLLCIVPVQILF